MRASFAVAAVLGLLASSTGCSSVPDVEYVDVDGAASNDSSSGASDGGQSGDEYDCSGKKPPPEHGICCGERLCLKCKNANQCDRCERADCDDDEVCCARNPGTVECRRLSDCN